MGVDPTDTQMLEFMSEADADENGRVSLNEYISVIVGKDWTVDGVTLYNPPERTVASDLSADTDAIIGQTADETALSVEGATEDETSTPVAGEDESAETVSVEVTGSLEPPPADALAAE